MTDLKDILTKEYLQKEYIDNQKSIRVIARELGLKSQHSVTQYIKKYGLYRPPKKDISKILTKEYLYDKYVRERCSLKDIALEVNSSKAVIKKYLILRNIPLRIKGKDLTKKQEVRAKESKENKTELSNKIFGLLKVVEFSHVNKSGNLVWKCECQCDNKNIVFVSGYKLRNHFVRSCGCLKPHMQDIVKAKLTKTFLEKELIENQKGLSELSRETKIHYETVRYYAIKYNIEYTYDHDFKKYHDLPVALFNKIYRNARKKKVDFDITIEYVWDLFLKQNKKCKYTNVILTFPKSTKENQKNLYTASLDRIDSSKGYIEGNVQWVHKRINIMKLDMEELEFLNWCKLVSDNIK